MSEEVNNEQLNTEVTEEMRQIANEQAKMRADDPTEMAATMHSLYAPRFKAMLKDLSASQVKNILCFLVDYPIAQDDIETYSDTERQIAHLGNQLVECKFLMIMDTYRRNAELMLEQAEKLEENKGDSNE